MLGRREGGPEREQRREGRLGFVDLDFEGCRVDCLHADGVLELGLLGGIRVGSGVVIIAANNVGQDVLVVPGDIRVAGALDAQDEVLGGERLAVRPLQVLLQRDRVSLAVTRDLRGAVSHGRLRVVVQVKVIQAAPDVHHVGDVLREVGEVWVPGFELGCADGDGTRSRLGLRGWGCFASAAAAAVVTIIIVVVVAAGDGDGHDGEHGEHAQEHPPFGPGHR